MRNRGFTIMELWVVLIVMGVFAALGIINYRKVVEKSTVDREGKSYLRMLQAAQLMFYSDHGSYYPSSGSVTDINLINRNLGVTLPAVADEKERHWGITVYSSGCVQVNRTLDDKRQWYLPLAEDEVKSGSCP